jgi:hypothetical protein
MYLLKTLKMKKFTTSNNVLRCACIIMIFSSVSLFSCDDDDPKREDTPELITTVSLTFAPTNGGTTVTATATDPDGEGVQDIAADGPIRLAPNTTYSLKIDLINGLADPTSEAYDVGSEVQSEADEHLFFFAWTNALFENPPGDGNIDNRGDQIGYQDTDANGLPLGLLTGWTTGAPSNGTFRIVLKHQPELKSETSGADTGESDLDVEFDVVVN